MPYSFQLPRLTDLTIAQQSVLNETRPVAISGGPGTGKSVISLWRHMQTHDLGFDRGLLLTYTTTLATYLRAAARSATPGAENTVFRTQDWLYHHASACDEMIVDEAQDLPESIYRRLRSFAPNISYGADDQQSIYPEQASTEEQLKRLFPHNEPYFLDENFRNTFEIMQFVRAALPNKLIFPRTIKRLEKERRGPKPRVVVTRYSQPKQNQELLGIIRTFMSPDHNIAVLVPFKTNVDRYHRIIVDNGIVCSKYHYEEADLPMIENVHVTTFASAKGTEFDTVIIPNFQNFRYFMKTMFVASENHYYVAFTRARVNLYLLAYEAPTDIHSSTFEIDDK